MARGAVLTPLGQRLVKENLGLAYREAIHGRRYGLLDDDERKSIAIDGLIEAVMLFRPCLGYSFSTYASVSIRRTLMRASLRDRVISVCPHGPDRFAAQTAVALAIRSIDDLGRDGRTWEPPMAEEPIGEELDRAVELRRLLDEIKALPDRHRRVIRGRLDGRTLQSIGDEIGLTKERVRQVEREARRMLRSRIEADECRRSYAV